MKTTNKISKWCKRTLMLLPAVAILTLAACEKEDTPNPFEGGDNHITSFVLTKGDVSYTAAVAAGTITVTVPEDVSLEGFTATYRLSENAEIVPDPATITDWESEHQFRVTAYNGTKAEYTYTVERSVDFEGGDKYITSFALTKDDVSYTAAIKADTITVTIPENVSLEGFTAEYRLSEKAGIDPKPDTVTNWEREHLFRVTAYNGEEFEYAYTVKRLAGGKTHSGAVILHTQAELNGFGSLSYTAIDGYLTIGRTTGDDIITSLAPLASLKAVTGAILINATFEGELTAFEKLETVGELTVLAKNVTKISFPKLTAVRTSLNIDQEKPAGYGTYMPPILTTNLNFPELTTIDKSLRIYYADELTTMNFPKLGRIREDLIMEGAGPEKFGKINSVNFPALTEVGGAIRLKSVYTSSFVANELKTAGTFSINIGERLGAITLPKLETLDEFSITKLNITIRGEALTRLQLPALTSVKTMNLDIPDAYTFQLTLDALTEAKTLNLDFWRATALTLSLPALEEVETLYVRSGTGDSGTMGDYGGLHALDMSASVAVKKAKTLTIDCIELTSIALPASLEEVETLILKIPEITTLSLPAALMKVGTLDFTSDKITAFTLPASLEELGTLKLTLPNLQTIDLPASLKEVGTLSLSLPGVTAFTLPASLEDMGTLTLIVDNATTFDLSATKGNVGLLTLSFPNATTFDMDLGQLEVGTLKLDLPKVTTLAPTLKKVGTFDGYNFGALTRLDVTGVTAMDILKFDGQYSSSTVTLAGPQVFPGKLSFGFFDANISPKYIKLLAESGCFEEVGALDLGVSETNTRSYLNEIDFPWLKRVTGMVTVGNTPGLYIFSLPNLQSVGGLEIADAYSTNGFTTFDLSSLETVTASGLALPGRGLRKLTKVELPKLKTVVGNISITGFSNSGSSSTQSKVATISFPELESLTGTLTINTTSATHSVPALTTLQFDKLTSAGGVTIDRFTNLKNFCPLKPATSTFAADKWSVTSCGYNPTYQNMVDGNCSN